MYENYSVQNTLQQCICLIIITQNFIWKISESYQYAFLFRCVQELANFNHIFQVTSLVLAQCYACPTASQAHLKNIGK